MVTSQIVIFPLVDEEKNANAMSNTLINRLALLSLKFEKCFLIFFCAQAAECSEVQVTSGVFHTTFKHLLYEFLNLVLIVHTLCFVLLLIAVSDYQLEDIPGFAAESSMYTRERISNKNAYENCSQCAASYFASRFNHSKNCMHKQNLAGSSAFIL